jgi:hypothetical protein|tara:strand:- start:45 stop:194 length:150 start_codon:yes stop_codon:yes gene_type:complete
MANEIEFLMYMMVLMGCAYTSYQIGISTGVHDTISFFHEEGIIKLDDED